MTRREGARILGAKLTPSIKNYVYATGSLRATVTRIPSKSAQLCFNLLEIHINYQYCFAC